MLVVSNWFLVVWIKSESACNGTALTGGPMELSHVLNNSCEVRTNSLNWTVTNQIRFKNAFWLYYCVFAVQPGVMGLNENYEKALQSYLQPIQKLAGKRLLIIKISHIDY